MTPDLVLFAILALVSVVAAVWMITTKNPVRSALFLVATFLCMAVFYVTLSAQFIAAVQVIVYAGAIMVLFLFVIMLLNLGAPQALREPGGLQRPVAVVLGILFIAALAASSSLDILQKTKPGGDYAAVASPRASAATQTDPYPVPPVTQENIGTVETIGYNLFSPSQPWLFPFEVTSILLLVAVIGAIIMAKRQV